MKKQKVKKQHNQPRTPEGLQYCKTTNGTLDESAVFTRTGTGTYALKEEAYRHFLEFYEFTLELRTFFHVAWETGGRVSELTKILRDNVKGNEITMLNIKKQQKKPEFKTLNVSHKTQQLVEAYLETHDNEYLFYHTPQYYRDHLQPFHKKLTPHCFRRGLGVFMQNRGASKDYIAARLGHKDLRSLPAYMKPENSESNSFMALVFEGKNTRRMSDLSVDEFEALMARVREPTIEV